MKKKNLLKKLFTPFLVPATRSYLSKARNTTFFGLKLAIPKGVFHPGLFFSTKTLWQFLATQTLKNKKILEIGCGSGAISILASKAGANIFCCDINSVAVNSTRFNAHMNKVELRVYQSNLFEKIEESNFDLILNNPPYYPRNPVTIDEHAWYAGKNFEYFEKLFKQTKKHLGKNGTLFLVLSDNCEIGRINLLASNENFEHNVVYTRTVLLEKIYVIQYRVNSHR